MIIEATYLSYLVISIALTVWVARTLSKNGRVFLVNSFASDERLADSVNHLLVVGFYLINMGYVTLALRLGTKPESTQGAIDPSAYFGQDTNALDRMSTDFAKSIVSAILEAF